ncbi:GNAT family N-acetyltransferase [Actinomycetospora sp. CA-084318]|uniref:GNAT family N-acetyltransferase n=1 Tax=Actinomycetospora sp. CA-084318 TaxID=3239892 RepID=UPI003D959775
MTGPTITLHDARPDTEPGLGALRGYVADVIGRMNGRPATDEEIDAFVAESPHGGLVPPEGVFVLATGADGVLLGCAGLRVVGPGVPDDAAEIKRMWTAPAARGLGVGKALLTDLLRRAREAGCARVVLDTRADLVEARTLYERAGFVEVEPYNENPYAQVWYALDLR